MNRTAIPRDVSPFLRRRGFLEVLGRDRYVHEVPGDPATLRAIRDRILEILGMDLGRLLGHVVTNHLRAEADHYLGVHVMGYEFNESGALDSDMERWAWRTGLGSYSSDPLSRWTTSIGDAIHLSGMASPHLRMSLRVGGRRNGIPTRAWFSARAPDGLAGIPVPLPEAWPKATRAHPAAAVCCAMLEAVALAKEAAAASGAAAA